MKKPAFSIIALLLACLILPFGSLAEAKRNRKIGDVIELKGKISVKRKDKKIKLKKGSGLKEKDVLQTKDKQLLFFDFRRANSKIRLAGNTQVTLLDKGSYNDEPNLKIQKGTLWGVKNPGDHVLRIKSTLGVLKVLEAQFFILVGPGDTEKIAVKKGRVEVEGEFGRIVLESFSEATLFSGVPPIIKGISDNEFVQWGEPFEGY